MNQEYTKALICGHCGCKGLSKNLASYNERDIETTKSPCGYLIKEIMQPWGTAYVLSMCCSCNEVTLTKIFWHDDRCPEDYTYVVLYPGKKATLQPV